jgi:hypothetical protein
MSETEPAEMSDRELYEAFQRAKSQGPVERLDALQLEISKRWEAEMSDK